MSKESFAAWWGRNRGSLNHLPADLCEQWIYKHLTNSPFCFPPLDSLSWSRACWTGEKLLASVYRAWGGELEPSFDYATFQGRGGDDRLQTAVALDAGTWDYPMVLLSTPDGVIDLGEVRPDVRFVIVEGHQRHRYLNAMHALGRPPMGPHQVIILHTPLTEDVGTPSGHRDEGDTGLR